MYLFDVGLLFARPFIVLLSEALNFLMFFFELTQLLYFSSQLLNFAEVLLAGFLSIKE